jgi:hypothetical protein
MAGVPAVLAAALPLGAAAGGSGGSAAGPGCSSKSSAKLSVGAANSLAGAGDAPNSCLLEGVMALLPSLLADDKPLHEDFAEALRASMRRRAAPPSRPPTDTAMLWLLESPKSPLPYSLLTRLSAG